MKTPSRLLALLLFVGCAISSNAQTQFTLQAYQQYLDGHQNLSVETLMSEFALTNTYYKGNTADSSLGRYAFLDSIGLKYNLTTGELGLLKQNHFMVSERLNFNCFGQAFHDIYSKDLPVMLTTDAVLQALHASYNRILMDVETAVLKPKLDSILTNLATSFSALLAKYGDNAHLADALADVDLYVTMARSLLAEKKLSSQFCSDSTMDAVWNAVQSERFVTMPLFSDRDRYLDFSQFTVRGHYTFLSWDPVSGDEKAVLASYFKSMMWLGRIDFLLTSPPDDFPWTLEEIRRMNLGAFMLGELLDLSGKRETLDSMDRLIRMMAGDSDNLTPDEFKQIIQQQGVTSADQLLDDSTYDAFQAALKVTNESGQKILSDCFIMDPFSSTPDPLPVSFKLMGQRFIVDSYIFSNLVYDRIIYQNQKIWRPMPDPLDALFVLGNDNALPLLKSEMDQYHYSSQAASLRYLVDAYDESTWDASLYNVWLNAIRLLNPPEDLSAYPFFMRTAAWQQEKMNTQLASWSQLRHDFLLYAKQSYTGMTTCSFPHSFIEPYPDFYKQIARFSENAKTVFAEIPVVSYENPRRIAEYFSGLETLMLRLETLARKELDRVPFSVEETDFLKKMMFVTGGSGSPPYSGWFADLYYNPYSTNLYDFIVVDVHTQPTDELGNPVGRILHVGTGKINLGVFLADSPSSDFQPMAFVGPVMSYYEKFTEGFDRLTDERWSDMVSNSGLPKRPDWVNVYLADAEGGSYPEGRELSSMLYSGVDEPTSPIPEQFALRQNYPNPFNPSTQIDYALDQPENVKLVVYDTAGRLVQTLVEGRQNAGNHSAVWNPGGLASGVYFCRLQTESRIRTIKMLLIR